MNSKMSKNTLREWALLTSLMIPAIGWAQTKTYIPPRKVYTPPPQTTTAPRRVAPAQPQRQQSSVPKQPARQSQNQQRQQPTYQRGERSNNQASQQPQVRQDGQRQPDLQRQDKRQQRIQRNEEHRQRRQWLKQQRQELKARRKREKEQVKRQKEERKRERQEDKLRARQTGRHTVDLSRQSDSTINEGDQSSRFSRGGIDATFRADGSFRSLKINGMRIDRGPHGERRIETQMLGGGRIVSTGPHSGFVERPLVRNGQSYVQRTYVVGGRTYVSLYRTYSYHSVVVYQYVPAYFYAPSFYGWAYYPWGPSVTFAWGWYSAPWFAYYGPYFAPYPAYPSASLWLTDYLLAQDLQLAYQDHSEDRPEAEFDSGSGGATEHYSEDASATPLTPEVKLAIAQEVHQQLASDHAAAANPGQTAASDSGNDFVPPALDPKIRVFVVSSNLTETNTGGQECGLTPGDVITRLTDAPNANQGVTVSVLSSKLADCPAGSQLTVAVQDLQEMHNDFRKRIDAGLGTLAQNEGRGGLPTGPAADPRPASDVQAAAPQTNAQAMLEEQQGAADQAEAKVRQSASFNPTVQRNP